jgi:hypothetical protein
VDRKALAIESLNFTLPHCTQTLPLLWQPTEQQRSAQRTCQVSWSLKANLILLAWAIWPGCRLPMASASTTCPESDPGVEPGVSTVPGAGTGLFATRDFAAGEVVCTYRGKVLRTAAAFKLEPSSKLYLMRVAPQCYVDAAAPDSCMARYINDAGRPGAQNCWFDKQPRLPSSSAASSASRSDCDPGAHGRGTGDCATPEAQGEPGALVRALRDIHSGEELFAPYGKWYWMGYKGDRGVAPVSAKGPATAAAESSPSEHAPGLATAKEPTPTLPSSG